MDYKYYMLTTNFVDRSIKKVAIFLERYSKFYYTIKLYRGDIDKTLCEHMLLLNQKNEREPT